MMILVVENAATYWYFECNLMRMHILRRQEGPEKCIAFALVEVNTVNPYTANFVFLWNTSVHIWYIKIIHFLRLGKYGTKHI